MKNTLTRSLASLAIGAVLLVPSIAGAQNWHRSSQKNQWKDIAIGAGALGVLGALSHNDTLTAIGAAAALYSAYRYDADGRSYRHEWNSHQHRYDWVRDPDHDRDRDGDRDRGNYNRDRDGDRDRDHQGSRASDRNRDWDRNSSRDRDGDRDRGNSSRNRDRDRDQSRSRNNDRGGNRDNGGHRDR